MEYLMEFLLELLLEGSVEVSSNKKIPKIVRYPLIIFIILFFAFIISVLFIAGIMALKKNIWGGLFILLVGLLLLIASILGFKKVYLEKKPLLEEKKNKK